jgi:segregation and condensation protein B
MLTENQMKQVIEALIFASHEPLPLNKIREIIDTIQPMPLKEIRTLLQTLKIEYDVQQRAFRLDEIAQGFVLRTREEYSRFIELLGKQARPEKLSPAASEVLAIIAYRQPITRGQIEAIRGVDSSGVISNLLERQLIHPTGKLEAPGRPTLYGITQTFLKYFGLKDIKELPKLQEPQP